MKKILIDSGPLIALFDASDKYHEKAVRFIKHNKLSLISTIASVTETLHLLDFNRDAQIDFLEWIHKGAVEIHPIENSDFGRIKVLTERMGKFGLELHPDKTRLIEFGRFAETDRRKRGQGKPETFDFLGFTHSCSKTKNGKFFIRRKTIKKRFVKKCKEVKQELKERMHDNVVETGKWLNSVIKGFQNYYAVPGNMNLVKSFYDQTTRAWLHTLRRRSQKGRNFTWNRFEKLIRWLIPRVRMIHPFPSQRFQRYYPR